MSKHAPGPWYVGEEDFEDYDPEDGGGKPGLNIWADDYLDDGDGYPIAVCLDHPSMWATARLIAEAPILLDTLREVEAYLTAQSRHQPFTPPAILEDVRAAIARAEGR